MKSSGPDEAKDVVELLFKSVIFFCLLDLSSYTSRGRGLTFSFPSVKCERNIFNAKKLIKSIIIDLVKVY